MIYLIFRQMFDGKVVALSSNTIAFIPEKKLNPGTEYQVTLNLDKLITLPKEKEAALSKFNFTVKTIKQDFTINTIDIQSYSKAISIFELCT